MNGKKTTQNPSEGVPPPKKRPFGLWDVGAIALIAFALLVLTLAVLLPRGLGLAPYVITSVSMEPTLRRGDLVFVAPVQKPPAPGNVVTFRVGESVVTHRVYSAEPDGTLRTKADSADRLDPGAVAPEDVLGRVVYRIPLLGYWSIWMAEEGAL